MRPGSSLGRGWGAIDNPTPGDVVKALDELGITVTKITEAEAHARCPGHERTTGARDRNPSWSCNTDTGLHGCWSCGYRGNFVQLVELVLDVDRATASAWIRARGALDYVKRQLTRPARRTRPAVNEAALALFVDPPLSACSARLLDPQAVRDLGILWDPARDMWIIPIRDPDTGRLLGYQEKNAKYFRNRPDAMEKSRSLFGLDTFPGGQAVLVESPLDVARLLTCGIIGGLASYGVRVSAAQLDLLVERADELVLALDNDRDGRALTLDLLRRAAGRIPATVWNYGGDAKDPGEQTAEEIRWSHRQAHGSLAYRLGWT